MRYALLLAPLLLISAACFSGSDLPTATPTSLGASSTPASLLPSATACPQREYTIQAGDTLLAIAIQYDVEVQDIQAANALGDPNQVQAGQVIAIPCPEATATPAATDSR